MKILMVGLGTFEEMTGGSARYLSGLRDGLVDAGHEVRVLTGIGSAGRRASNSSGVFARIERSIRRVGLLMPRTFLSVVRMRPDVVNVHYAADGLAAVAAARLARIPVVVHFHGPWADEAIAAGRRGPAPGATSIRLAIERWTYSGSTRVIVLSQAFATKLIADYGVDPNRIRIIPGGIDPTGFRFPPDRPEARRRLGLQEVATIVTVRRLVPRMGLDLAIRAMALLPRSDVRLVIAGTGPQSTPLEQLAGELGLGERVVFVGRVPDDKLPLVYAAGDICLVPTRELEGFGYVALEALATGTPVIATSIGGLVDLVGGLEPRWLVPAEPDAMATAITTFLEGAADYPDRAACQTYAAGFAWEHIVPQVEAIFEEARTVVDPGGSR